MKKRFTLRLMVSITLLISITVSFTTIAYATDHLPEEAIKFIENIKNTISECLPEPTVPSTPEETTSNVLPTNIFSADFFVSDSEENNVNSTAPTIQAYYNYLLQVEENTLPTEEIINPTEESIIFTEETTAPTQEATFVDLEKLDKEPLKIFEIEKHEDGTKIFRFKRQNYTVPYNPINEEPMVSLSDYTEQITEVPHYFQQEYPYTNYGFHGTVSSHGCGITSCAMVYSYLLDKPIMPDTLAKEYGRFNTEVGSDYRLFETSADDYGLTATRTYKWEDVENALKNGGVVIANVRKNIFTSGGHYIVYYGITDEGKILVRDPSIYNYGEWSNIYLKEGFLNVFDQKHVKYSFPCWIFNAKDIEYIAELNTVK